MKSINKPVIVINYNNATISSIKKIVSGIEEEGVLCETNEININDIYEICFDATSKSSLEIGIGVLKNEVGVVVRNMQKNEFLFRETIKNEENLFELGSNSARYVKGIPFKVYR